MIPFNKLEAMTRKIQFFSLFAALLFMFAACEEEQLGESRIDDSTPQLSELDQWLRDTYVYPYNVEVKYKWEDYEGDMTKNLVPPAEEMVQPLMDVMDKVWVKCYEEEGGETFIKSNIPKLIYLLGGAGVNPEGTIVQGTAEAGRKIVLYEVNKFEASNSERINRFFHVMHHEFAHILHQKKLYDTDAFEAISKAYYRSDWYNVSDSDIEGYMGYGFVSPYAMSSRDEDFVEVIAYMLTRTKEQWDAYIRQEGADSVMLKAKEAIVNDYFTNIWDMDIFELQQLIADNIEEVVGTEAEPNGVAPFVHNDEHVQVCSKCEILMNE